MRIDWGPEGDASRGARLDVSVTWVEQPVDRGTIGTRHGTRWLFTAAELDAYRAATHRKGGRPRKQS